MGRQQNIRYRTLQLLGDAESTDAVSRTMIGCMGALILINVLAVILSTVASIEQYAGHVIRNIELISIIIFTIEYIVRLWAHGKLRVIFTSYMLIDLLAILPFYLPMIIPVDLRFLRILRLLRTMRILKMARYSHSIQIVGTVLRKKASEIAVIGFMLIVMLVISASFMYFAEHEVQPEKFSSIPESLWWSVVTVTTVGYGDIFPITPMGKFFGALIALLGIGFFALPAGILGSGFIEAMNESKKQSNFCPHCGQNITNSK